MRFSTYALTISPAKRPQSVVKFHLDWVLQELLEKHDMVLKSKVYEISKNGYLHMHAEVLASSSIYRKSVKYPGYSVVLKKLKGTKNVARWRRYMTKNVRNSYEQERILDEHYFKHNYAFQLPSEQDKSDYEQWLDRQYQKGIDEGIFYMEM